MEPPGSLLMVMKFLPIMVSFSRHSVVIIAYMEKTQCGVCYIYKTEIAVDLPTDVSTQLRLVSSYNKRTPPTTHLY